MEIITMPRPIRWIWASLGAYWLAHIIHPGFVSIAIMALLMIPLLIADLMFPPRPPVPVKHSAEESDEEQIPGAETEEDQQNSP